MHTDPATNEVFFCASVIQQGTTLCRTPWATSSSPLTPSSADLCAVHCGPEHVDERPQAWAMHFHSCSWPNIRPTDDAPSGAASPFPPGEAFPACLLSPGEAGVRAGAGRPGRRRTSGAAARGRAQQSRTAGSRRRGSSRRGKAEGAQRTTHDSADRRDDGAAAAAPVASAGWRGADVRAGPGLGPAQAHARPGQAQAQPRPRPRPRPRPGSGEQQGRRRARAAQQQHQQALAQQQAQRQAQAEQQARVELQR